MSGGGKKEEQPMGQKTKSKTPGTQSSTVTESVAETASAQPETPQQLRLREASPEAAAGEHVTWDASIAALEIPNQKTSNCCCIYVKPKKWDDPSPSNESEGDHENHCKQHVDLRGKKIKIKPKPAKKPEQKKPELQEKK